MKQGGILLIGGKKQRHELTEPKEKKEMRLRARIKAGRSYPNALQPKNT